MIDYFMNLIVPPESYPKIQKDSRLALYDSRKETSGDELDPKLEEKEDRPSVFIQWSN